MVARVEVKLPSCSHVPRRCGSRCEFSLVGAVGHGNHSLSRHAVGGAGRVPTPVPRRHQCQGVTWLHPLLHVHPTPDFSVRFGPAATELGRVLASGISASLGRDRCDVDGRSDVARCHRDESRSARHRREPGLGRRRRRQSRRADADLQRLSCAPREQQRTPRLGSPLLVEDMQRETIEHSCSLPMRVAPWTEPRHGRVDPSLPLARWVPGKSRNQDGGRWSPAASPPAF